MKYRLALLTLVLLSIAFPVFAQRDFASEFENLFGEGDFEGQLKVLKEWEAAKPNDPELFVSFFNHYLSKSRKQTLVLGTDKPKGDSVKLEKTDSPDVVAYLGTDVKYDAVLFRKAIEYLDKGITAFPDRLDMRFGKTFAYGQIGDFKTFAEEIVRAVERSGQNGNRWLWKKDKPVENPKKFMLDAVQGYVGQLFDSDRDPALKIRAIAGAVIKLYPDSVENLSNLGTSYLLQDDFDGALPHYLKAEKLAPTDHIVLANIAYCYFMKKDKPNAVKYYQLVLKYGNDETKAQARAKLAELN